jgi:hypothetical protein
MPPRPTKDLDDKKKDHDCDPAMRPFDVRSEMTVLAE